MNFKPTRYGEKQFVPSGHETKPNTSLRLSCCKCNEIKEVACYVQPGFPIPEAPIYTCPSCAGSSSAHDNLDDAPGALADHLKNLPKRLVVIKNAAKRWGKTHPRTKRGPQNPVALKRASMKYRASLYGLRFNYDMWVRKTDTNPLCLCGIQLTKETACCDYRHNFRALCRSCASGQNKKA
jgi:hypothetical protein